MARFPITVTISQEAYKELKERVEKNRLTNPNATMADILRPMIERGLEVKHSDPAVAAVQATNEY